MWLKDEANYTCDEGDNDESRSLANVTHDAVTISTVHGAKGLEWAACWLPDLAMDVFPTKERPTNLHKILGGRTNLDLTRFDTKNDDEIKVCYVALTRAAKYLFPTYAPIPAKNGRSLLPPSPYLLATAAMTGVTKDPALLPVSARIPAANKLPAISRQEQYYLTLTFSQLFYYFLCPHQFYLRFLAGFPPPVSPAIGYPKTLHDAAAELDKRLATGEQLQDDDLHSICERHFKMPFASENEKTERLAAAKAALAEYSTCYQAQGGNTEFVEREVRLDVGNVTVLGRIDRSYFTNEGKLRLIEHKTSHEAANRDAELIQLQVYAAAYESQTGRLPDEVGVNLTGVNGAGEQVTPISPDQIKSVKNRVVSAGGAILSGQFDARPANGKLTCTKCDVCNICNYYQSEQPKT